LGVTPLWKIGTLKTHLLDRTDTTLPLRRGCKTRLIVSIHP
jgi:hypothetical protein